METLWALGVRVCTPPVLAPCSPVLQRWPNSHCNSQVPSTAVSYRAKRFFGLRWARGRRGFRSRVMKAAWGEVRHRRGSRMDHEGTPTCMR